MSGVFKKMRKPRLDREGQEQAAFFTWLYLRHREAWELAFHVPNGGSRNKIEAAKLKAQGVKSGVPDIFIDLPRGGYCGLRIELKATPPHDADVAKSQREWIGKLQAQGYRAVVCRGLDAAKGEIEHYLAMDGDRQD